MQPSMHVAPGVHLERRPGGMVRQPAGEQDHEWCQVGRFREAIEMLRSGSVTGNGGTGKQVDLIRQEQGDSH